jgi:hypothetical protein
MSSTPITVINKMLSRSFLEQLNNMLNYKAKFFKNEEDEDEDENEDEDEDEDEDEEEDEEEEEVIECDNEELDPNFNHFCTDLNIDPLSFLSLPNIAPLSVKDCFTLYPKLIELHYDKTFLTYFELASYSNTYNIIPSKYIVINKDGKKIEIDRESYISELMGHNLEVLTKGETSRSILGETYPAFDIKNDDQKDKEYDKLTTKCQFTLSIEDNLILNYVKIANIERWKYIMFFLRINTFSYLHFEIYSEPSTLNGLTKFLGTRIIETDKEKTSVEFLKIYYPDKMKEFIMSQIIMLDRQFDELSTHELEIVYESKTMLHHYLKKQLTQRSLTDDFTESELKLIDLIKFYPDLSIELDEHFLGILKRSFPDGIEPHEIETYREYVKKFDAIVEKEITESYIASLSNDANIEVCTTFIEAFFDDTEVKERIFSVLKKYYVEKVSIPSIPSDKYYDELVLRHKNHIQSLILSELELPSDYDACIKSLILERINTNFVNGKKLDAKQKAFIKCLDDISTVKPEGKLKDIGKTFENIKHFVKSKKPLDEKANFFYNNYIVWLVFESIKPGDKNIIQTNVLDIFDILIYTN